MTAAAKPIIPQSAPFAPEQIEALNGVMVATSSEQRQWLAGFLAGYAAASAGQAQAHPPATAPAAAPRAKLPLSILYATQSGNSEAVAYDAQKVAKRQGFDAKAIDVADLEPGDLAEHKNVMLVAATWGEGDPPERAEAFIKGLLADDAPKLDGVRFSVLALGDTSYVNFCETGRQLDRRLEELGATRVAERVEADLDFAGPAADWTKSVLGLLQEQAPQAEQPGSVIHVDFHQQQGGAQEQRASEIGTRAHPFDAEIAELVNISSSRSSKEIWHVGLSLEGSGITYEPGDALGILPQNDPAVVDAVLKAARIEGDDELLNRLARELEITTLTRPVVQAYAELSGSADLKAMVEGEGWRDYIAGNHLVDLLDAFPSELDGERLAGILRRLPPRLYSIASSLRANPQEAHLTVGLVNWTHRDEQRSGVTSGQLARRLKRGETLPIYIQPNRHFRVPTDPAASTIMVGAGTGVAPFRAFMQERQEKGDTGDNWLFFGERQYTHDFLYQLDWQDFMKERVLSRIDLAFSRDQPEKRYVQHALWDRRDDVFRWLEEGAHFYVCGAIAMGKDVEDTLKRIAGEQGRDADAWLAELRKSNRYQRDVY